MPLAALVEVALQPCGVLAAYLDSTTGSETDVLFRNLDGDLEITGRVGRGVGTLRTRVELLSSAGFGGNIIQSYTIDCQADGMPVLAGTAVFGFFSRDALEGQIGLPPTTAEPATPDVPRVVTAQLRDRPARHFGGPLRLPGPMLLMLDRITGFRSDGGAAGLGWLRAERDIDPADWYFKAHFFGDPVQPGSLGLEAMGQLLQVFCIETGLGAGVPDRLFEPAIIGRSVIWRFRGQVLPTDGMISVEAEILEVGEDFVRAQGWLSVDGRRIYHAPELGIRIVPGTDTAPAIVGHLLDPADAAWLDDHRPTWTIPVLPMMSTVELLAAAAHRLTGRQVTGLSDVALRRWVPVTQPSRLRTVAVRSDGTVAASLQVWREAGRLSRFEEVASATVHLGLLPPLPDPFAPLADARPVPDVYESGEMFHGPAFHYLSDLRVGPTGSTGTIDAGAGAVPRGYLHQGLLDAIFHVVPHTTMWRWVGKAGRDQVAFPHRIPTLTLYEPLPDDGDLRVEARFAGYDGGDPRLPVTDLQVFREDRLLLAVTLVEGLLPIGPLARVTLREQRAFLRDHVFVEGLHLGTIEGGSTVVSVEELARLDWLPGWLGPVYGLPESPRITDHVQRIAVATHVARATKVHPFRISVGADLSAAWVVDRPDDVRRVSVTEHDGRVTVVDA